MHAILVHWSLFRNALTARLQLQTPRLKWPRCRFQRCMSSGFPSALVQEVWAEHMVTYIESNNERVCSAKLVRHVQALANVIASRCRHRRNAQRISVDSTLSQHLNRWPHVHVKCCLGSDVSELQSCQGFALSKQIGQARGGVFLISACQPSWGSCGCGCSAA